MNRILTFLLWLSLAVLELHAQVGTDASILGIVRDSSGAVVPGAEVTVVNRETGLTRTVVSDGKGYFEILALPRGVYDVSVALASFRTWKLQKLELILSEQKRIAPSLEIGAVNQEVTVESGVELIQTEKASIEGVVEQRQIRDLPLNGRNPIELVNLVPGMRFTDIGGFAREHTVQGVGQRDDQTRFTVDGLDSMDPSNDKGIVFPNVDTVSQFSVQTSNFTAETGKNPLQVIVATKSGTNNFHGTLWEFHRNFHFDARNAFALTNPKLIRNQFGFTIGGPVIKNRTFFFGSFEGTRIRQERVYNSVTVAPEMLQGDFSSLTRNITDPSTGQAFPNKIISTTRFSTASKFLFPYLILPNSSGNRFRAVAPAANDLGNNVWRIDHQLTATQRVSARWIRVTQDQANPQTSPDIIMTQNIAQQSAALSYNWSLTPKTLLDIAVGFVHSNTDQDTPAAGKNNLTQQAGIQGFQTDGRAEAVGLPTVSLTGYTGFGLPNNTPGFFGREDLNAKASMNLVRGKHSIGYGYEWDDRRTATRHASASSRGTFTFNGQYTGDGFADFLLGYLSAGERNYPLKTFGIGHSPYTGIYIQDFWRIHPRLTINAGLRFDFWHEKSFVRDNGATFDIRVGKAVAAETSDGRVDLTAQPTAPYLSKSTEGLWIPASKAGMPHGLFNAKGYLSPRFGLAWRPLGGDSLVVRAGYGIFPTSFNGNVVGSAIIGPPYWTQERVNFVRTELRSWEKAFPADPTNFILPAVTAVYYDVNPMKIHQWNVTVQKALPFKSAVTLSYVGNRGTDMVTRLDHNEAPPARYTNYQSARPYPLLGNVRLYENIGATWYHSLQLRLDRRFTRGLGGGVAYAFSRNLDENGASLTDFPTPFAPNGYDRGRSQLERRHVLSVNSIWELPFGRGRAYANQLHPVLNVILGGWQLSGIYRFVSGTPLSFTVSGATLGNTFNTRANLVGNPTLDNPTVGRWFNKDAFTAPQQFTFGNSGIGLLDGPGSHVLDTALLKNFYFGENRYVQFRWELFNMPNHVNLGDPVTTIGIGTTAQISGADAARQMQFGLKIVF